MPYRAIVADPAGAGNNIFMVLFVAHKQTSSCHGSAAAYTVIRHTHSVVIHDICVAALSRSFERPGRMFAVTQSHGGFHLADREWSLLSLQFCAISVFTRLRMYWPNE